MTLHTASTVVSGVAFLLYGASCLVTDSMRDEFVRFGLERFRLLTGVLEMLGGAGLLIGLAWPPALRLAAAGLALLMLLGVGVRLRVGDGVRLMLPAAALLVVNVYILVRAR